MLIDFVKMQAQGNDFVILNGLESDLPALNLQELAKQMCDRHFGVGADGLVILSPETSADARMIIYNSDGSRAAMCGSALRCVASLTAENLGKCELNIQTDSGLKTASVDFASGQVKVNLGLPRLAGESLCVAGFCGDLVDVGNLHYIVYRDHLDDDPQLRYGSILEHHPDFPTTVNVHFVHRISSSEIQIKIWENACGATLACGTGAVASVFSGMRQALLKDSVKVLMPGGDALIRVQPASGEYWLEGRVEFVYSGQYRWKI